MAKSQEPTLLLIDGNALVHRAFHALPPLTAPDGRPTGAVYGFFSTLWSAIKQFGPTHLAVAFDVAGPTFRHKEYQDYKATRIKPPQALYDQIPVIQAVLQAMKIAQFGVQGYEADDILATLVAKTKNSHIVILTGDMDTLQLVDENVSVCALRRGIKDRTIYDEKTVQATFGFEPKYMIEYKALRGDPSDNIPGLPGIGDKTAATLIQKYQTIATLYQHLKELPDKLQTILRSHKNELAQTKQLLQLRDDVPLDFLLSKAATNNISYQAAIGQFQQLGMKSLAHRLLNSNHPTPKSKQNQLIKIQNSKL